MGLISRVSSRTYRDIIMTTNAEVQEKTRIIKQILDLQTTLEDLSSRVVNVISENHRLCQENGILGQYIENLMKESPIFSPAARKTNNSSNSNAKTPAPASEPNKPNLETKISNSSTVQDDETNTTS